MLATEQEARDVAEAAREVDWAQSFVKELFEGRLVLDLGPNRLRRNRRNSRSHFLALTRVDHVGPT